MWASDPDTRYLLVCVHQRPEPAAFTPGAPPASQHRPPQIPPLRRRPSLEGVGLESRTLPHGTVSPVTNPMQQLAHIFIASHHRGEAVTQQPMTARRGGARDRPGDSPDRAAEFGGAGGGVEGAGTVPGLGDEDGAGERGEEPASLQEPPLRRRRTRRQLRQQQAVLADTGQQISVPCRIQPIQAACEHGDR